MGKIDYKLAQELRKKTTDWFCTKCGQYYSEHNKTWMHFKAKEPYCPMEELFDRIQYRKKVRDGQRTTS